MNTTGLFNLSWQRYLNLLFLLLTVGFLTSGVVTLIAANLDYFSDLAKIYGLQTLLVVTVILGIYCFIRESRRQATEKLKWKTYSIFFVVSVLIGGLFALVGQTYQTGADVWQLFAVWTLCQLPFLLLFPNVASALLFAATANVAFYLFNEQNSHNSMCYAVLINAGLLVISELFSKTFHDQYWRILPKVFLVLTFVSLFGLIVIYDMYFYAYAWGELGRSPLSSLIIAIPALIALYVYHKYRFDFINLIISVIALLGAYCFLASLLIRGLEEGVVLGLIGFTFTVMEINWLVKRYKREYPNSKKFHWAISILWMIALLIALVTIGVWLFFSLGLDESSAFIVGILLFGIAWSITLNKDKNEYTTILAGLFFLIANSFLGFYLLVKFDDFFLLLGYEFSEDSNFGIFISALIFTVIIIVSYKLMPNSLVRILLVTQLLVFWQISYNLYFHNYSLNNTWFNNAWFNKIQLLSSIILFYWVMRPNQSARIHLKPIVWGIVLFSLWISVPSYMVPSYMAFPLVDYGLIDTDVSSDVMPADAMSIDNVLQVLSGQFWSHFQFDVSHILYLLVCALPLIVYALMNKHSESKHTEAVLILLVLTLFALGFVGIPVILYLTALLLLVYWTDSRAFFGLLVFAFVVYLGGFYYQLSIPLLYKGVLLVSFAVIFAIVTLFLHARYKAPSQSAVENHSVFKALIWLVGVFVITLLGAVNYKVQQFEDVLATGKPVVLKIAPVDPRSLMQGDYMVLNYAILSEFQQSQFLPESNESLETSESIDAGEANETTGIDESSPSGKKAYILVHLDKNHVATFCEKQSEIPTDFKHCTPNVYLPIRYKGWFPELPSQDYFFAEGKGEYYAQAEYAEYRFKDGILLLARLLDKDLKGL
ncbi:GDYXXLXY domain-containing protein [Haemophilus parainfluenzae]|uniref:GDYXXLXY domain-containing protein n=1 Tax=Haemophilus parainfluenzae TaxID=729 RepID=UPI0018A5DC31|nr:GDYXXLXY domain-containing protein [Haemophilus parainfluenzae]QOR09041.1 GDYXXLXY domain-containing protein [Haemophilus parainfluenzae]